jgi:hypothetical protein
MIEIIMQGSKRGHGWVWVGGGGAPGWELSELIMEMMRGSISNAVMWGENV